VNETSSFALLADLAQLIKKHGPTAFSDLASLLRDPAKVDDLTAILEAGSFAGRNAKTRKKKPVREGRRTGPISLLHLLSETRSTDPAKAELLTRFYEDLSLKRVLPSLRDLRKFASDNGLIGAAADSREKAIGPLVRDLRGRSVEQVREIIGRAIVTEGTKDDRSLERWTDIILDKGRSRKSS